MANNNEIIIQRTVASVDALQNAIADMNPILKQIIAAQTPGTTAQPFALPKHIQVSFSLSG